jgi:hypothetical protein
MKLCYVLILISLFVWTFLPAQEMVVNGGFDDESGWTVYDMGGDTPTAYEFGFAAEGPQYGNGPCLYVYTENPTTYTNILFWQAVTVEVGKTYRLSGAFKDITLDGIQPSTFWCEYYLASDEPVDGEDWAPPAGANSDQYLAFDSWTEGCATFVDGTFQDDGCGGKGSLYTVPDSLGTTGEGVIIYLGIKVGAGTWADPTAEFEVLIDEISLFDTSGTASGLEENRPEIASDFVLHQNYPNPFNPSTNISFSLPTKETVDVSIFDVQGQIIRTLTDNTFAAGTHNVKWNADNDQGASVPSGIYFYRLKSKHFNKTGKMILLR